MLPKKHLQDVPAICALGKNMTAPNEVTPKHPDIGELQRALMSTGRDDWMRLLEIFLPVGVVNTQQLQRATGLNRDAVNRRIQEFTRLAGNGILQRRAEDSTSSSQRASAGGVSLRRARRGAAQSQRASRSASLQTQ